MQSCKSRQYNDQMCCSKCGLSWDVNDPDPPECSVVKKAERNEAAADRAFTEIRAILGMPARK